MVAPPAKYDKLNHIKYSRESSSLRQCIGQDENGYNQVYLEIPVHQETSSTNQLTVSQMENGKGLVRNKNLTAIINLNPNQDVPVITPSKTHPSYYDVNVPNSNTDQI